MRRIVRSNWRIGWADPSGRVLASPPAGGRSAASGGGALTERRTAEAHRQWISELLSSRPHRRKRAIWWTGTFETRKWCEGCGFQGIVHGPGEESGGYWERHWGDCPYLRRRKWVAREVKPTMGQARSAGDELAEYMALGRIPCRIRAEQGLGTGRWHLHGLFMPLHHTEAVEVDRAVMKHARDHGFVATRMLQGAKAELAYLEKHETRLYQGHRAQFWPSWLVTNKGVIYSGI